MAYERKTHDIIISNELRDLLSEFESDSLVAKLLLKKRHDKESLVEDPINFISIANDRTKISYLTADRIEKLEPEQYWSSSRRFAARPGAFIGKIFKDIPSKEVEKFSNLYRAHSNKTKFNFEIVEGKKILKYYNIDSYAEERGTLGASCMKYGSCQSFFGIYTENPDVVKLLVMLNSDGMLIGRALLWNLETVKVMDRIYTIYDEEFLFQFKKWATDNGYLYKSEQNWYNTLNFENLSTPKQEVKLIASLKNFRFDRYPYVDTFKFINLSDGTMTNYQPDGSYRTLCSSDGGTYDSQYFAFDAIDRVLRHPGDCVYVNYLDIRTHSNNTRYSEINDQYILEKDCIYDDEIGEYIFNEEYNNLNNTERINERREYLRKRRSESASTTKKKKSKWLESIVGSYISDTNINEQMINEVYQMITERTGIPSGYFTYRMDESQYENNQDEPQPETQE